MKFISCGCHRDSKTIYNIEDVDDTFFRALQSLVEVNENNYNRWWKLAMHINNIVNKISDYIYLYIVGYIGILIYVSSTIIFICHVYFINYTDFTFIA